MSYELYQLYLFSIHLGIVCACICIFGLIYQIILHTCLSFLMDGNNFIVRCLKLKLQPHLQSFTVVQVPVLILFTLISLAHCELLIACIGSCSKSNKSLPDFLAGGCPASSNTFLPSVTVPSPPYSITGFQWGSELHVAITSDDLHANTVCLWTRTPHIMIFARFLPRCNCLHQVWGLLWGVLR